MKPQRKWSNQSWPRRGFTLFALLFLGLLAWFIFYPHHADQPPPPLPAELAGLDLRALVSGPEARRRLAHLHGTVIGLADAHKAVYGAPEGELTLWLARSPSATEARELFQAMDRRMPASPIFSSREELTVADRKIILVRGQGKTHYYWVTGRFNYWLEVEGVDGLAAVAELLAQTNPDH